MNEYNIINNLVGGKKNRVPKTGYAIGFILLIKSPFDLKSF